MPAYNLAHTVRVPFLLCFFASAKFPAPVVALHHDQITAQKVLRMPEFIKAVNE